MNVDADHIEMLTRVGLNISGLQVRLEKLLAVGAILLPEIDNQPALACLLCFLGILAQVKKAELEPVREREWFFQRGVIKLDKTTVKADLGRLHNAAIQQGRQHPGESCTC